MSNVTISKKTRKPVLARSACSRRDHEWDAQQNAILNAEYEEEKHAARLSGRPHTVTMSIICRRNGVKVTTLRNWRANHMAPCRANVQVELPPNGDSESKKGVVGG